MRVYLDDERDGRVRTYRPDEAIALLRPAR